MFPSNTNYRRLLLAFRTSNRPEEIPKNASRVQPNHQEKREACQKQKEQDKNTNRQKRMCRFPELMLPEMNSVYLCKYPTAFCVRLYKGPSVCLTHWALYLQSKSYFIRCTRKRTTVLSPLQILTNVINQQNIFSKHLRKNLVYRSQLF